MLGNFRFSRHVTWIWPLGLINDGSDGATLLLWLLLKNFFQRNVSVEYVCLICCNINTKKPISHFAVWKSDSARFNSLFSAKFWLMIRMDNGTSIHLFFHSLTSHLRLLFCSSMAFWDTLLGTVGLAGLGMDLRDLMVLFFFCYFFWELGMLERPETIVVWRYWFGHSLWPGKPRNSPRWCGRCHDGAAGAISTKQYTCLHWTVNEAICLSTLLPCLLNWHLWYHCAGEIWGVCLLPYQNSLEWPAHIFHHILCLPCPVGACSFLGSNKLHAGFLAGMECHGLNMACFSSSVFGQQCRKCICNQWCLC
jgi:hypothetical protein